MGYGDNRGGDDGRRGERPDSWRGQRDEGTRGGGHGRQAGSGEDRGFMERAGEQVRSWFGEDDQGPPRGGGNWRGNERHGSHEQGLREQGWRGGGDESWGRDQGWGRAERWSGDESFGGGWGNQAPHMDRGGGSDRGQGGSPAGAQGRGETPWGRDNSQGHDPHYSEWRQRQIEQLDRDYEEYRRENQSRFHSEFTGWREKRQGQRQSMASVTAQMEVIGSDGQHVGKVDKVSGDRIILAKNDPNAGGIHHSVPCSWIERVDSQVHVNRTAEQAMREWKDEERSRALFEREDSGSPGPHMLNRSFSGTYSDREER